MRRVSACLKSDGVRRRAGKNKALEMTGVRQNGGGWVSALLGAAPFESLCCGSHGAPPARQDDCTFDISRAPLQ